MRMTTVPHKNTCLIRSVQRQRQLRFRRVDGELLHARHHTHGGESDVSWREVEHAAVRHPPDRREHCIVIVQRLPHAFARGMTAIAHYIGGGLACDVIAEEGGGGGVPMAMYPTAAIGW